MAEDKPRLVRLTSMVTQLQSKRMITARDLADKHQVSIRTIYRDIQTLIQSGIPIITEEGKGYRLMEGYQLPPVLFTESEASALITAQHMMAHNSDSSLREAYSAALEKIQAVLRYSQKDSTELFSDRLQIRNYRQERSTSHYFMDIQKAVTHYQLLRIQYTSQEQKHTERDVEPFALIQTQEHWVMIAFCHLRQNFRMFRLDRIQHLNVLKQHFTPHDLTLEDFFEACREENKYP